MKGGANQPLLVPIVVAEAHVAVVTKQGSGVGAPLGTKESAPRRQLWPAKEAVSRGPKASTEGSKGAASSVAPAPGELPKQGKGVVSCTNSPRNTGAHYF